MRFLHCIIWFLITSITISISASEPANTNDKFNTTLAVVDVESILDHSLAVRHIKKSINELSDRIQQELTSKEIELKSIESALINERESLSKQEFDRKVSEFNDKVSQTQKEMQSKKAALEAAHSEAIAQVHKVTIEVIGELSKKHGYNVVLPSSQILFVESQKNITLEVITNLNERLNAVEIKYSPRK